MEGEDWRKGACSSCVLGVGHCVCLLLFNPCSSEAEILCFKNEAPEAWRSQRNSPRSHRWEAGSSENRIHVISPPYLTPIFILGEGAGWNHPSSPQIRHWEGDHKAGLESAQTGARRRVWASENHVPRSQSKDTYLMELMFLLQIMLLIHREKQCVDPWILVYC